jgi:Lysyl oxidase
MTRRRIFGLAALAVGFALAAAGAEPAVAGGAPAPSLRLFVAQSHIKLARYPHSPVFLDVGAYLASVGGAFQIDVTRANYLQPIEAAQIVTAGGGTQIIPLPDGLVKNWDGLPWFLRIDVNDAHGALVATRHVTFCPDGFDQERVNSTGPANPTFPQFCGNNPFTLGMVWGIDNGWAVNPMSSAPRPPFVRLADGTYTVHLSINPTYVRLFGIAPADAQATVSATVRTSRNFCITICPKRGEHHAGTSAGPEPNVPTISSPAPSTQPDLVALPAWGISTERQGKHDYLDFGATVWDRGPAPLVVEGFRRPNSSVMDAWQYFYDPSGAIVGRAKVGTLRYDAKPGHEHWHFQQFATYQLLDKNKTGIVYSDKTGFCLAPTDAIDLTVTGAVWNPGTLGFGGTVCGSQNSIWTREALPTGWGDTYFQGLPGQSFDITHLPNGTYFIAVKANPMGSLFERTTTNDIRYRRVILGGKPGARTVKVPPWNGINSEGGGGGIFPAHA